MTRWFWNATTLFPEHISHCGGCCVPSLRSPLPISTRSNTSPSGGVHTPEPGAALPNSPRRCERHTLSSVAQCEAYVLWAGVRHTKALWAPASCSTRRNLHWQDLLWDTAWGTQTQFPFISPFSSPHKALFVCAPNFTVIDHKKERSQSPTKWPPAGYSCACFWPNSLRVAWGPDVLTAPRCSQPSTVQLGWYLP